MGFYFLTNSLLELKTFKKMNIHKSKKAKGNFYHKTPSGTNANQAKSFACKEITDYIKNNKDFGEINYIPIERIVLISTSQNKPFTYFI